MANTSITKKNINDAINYIDKNGIPEDIPDSKYELVLENGKKYMHKYVVAIADHLATGGDINLDAYNITEAKEILEYRGFTVKQSKEKYKLTITANGFESTDTRFDINNLSLGDNYVTLDVYFEKNDGTIIRRDYGKSEGRNVNKTLPRLVFQIYESSFINLSDYDKKNYPIVKYRSDTEMIRGIYSSVEEYIKDRKTIQRVAYTRDGGPQFVIYCWNLFSTLYFVQESLKRFGDTGDRFILFYREKDEKEANKDKNATQNVEHENEVREYRNPLSEKLIQSKNIILRGAPGTGKTHLAREIAADIVSNGYYNDYESLTNEQKKQIEFVQFHPNYDYSDFVEGLRPKMNDDDSIGFELQDGIFKRFAARARKNYEDSLKTEEVVAQEASAKDALTNFFSNIEFGKDSFKTITGSQFYVTGVDEEHIWVSIPANKTSDKLRLDINELTQMLESGKDFNSIKDITNFFERRFATQNYSYDYALFKEIKKTMKTDKKRVIAKEQLKDYIFIIDEINRGEISKIMGELFFSIDPGYRGEKGAVSTQYSNMHKNPDDKFYVPENLYIIGTMNDIDRSVDSFDFAMRRRFRFIEVKVDDQLAMLDVLENEDLKNEAIARMTALNNEIISIEDLNENYQIGASYFLKLNELSFDELWTDSLKPLLKDYIQGMYDEENIMKRFERAYGFVD